MVCEKLGRNFNRFKLNRIKKKQQQWQSDIKEIKANKNRRSLKSCKIPEEKLNRFLPV